VTFIAVGIAAVFIIVGVVLSMLWYRRVA
jgi:hypothetical protein